MHMSGAETALSEQPRAVSFTRSFLCRVTRCQSWTRILYVSVSQISSARRLPHARIQTGDTGRTEIRRMRTLVVVTATSADGNDKVLLVL